MNLPKEFGGYFEFEFNLNEEYHKSAFALNSGRNAFEVILKLCDVQKILIPYYTCDVIINKLNFHKIQYDFYHINNELKPIIKITQNLNPTHVLLTNYFGICDHFMDSFSTSTKCVIIDNAQSFFTKQIGNLPSFNSCRKFFGVPDGAYLYLGKGSTFIVSDKSDYPDVSHLIKRIIHGARAGYRDYQKAEATFLNKEIASISPLSKKILCSMDYIKIMKQRSDNFLFLHERFHKINELKINTDHIVGPMVYPLLINSKSLKQKLISRNIYIATYWTNVQEVTRKSDFENYLTRYLIPVPIDQRYDIKDMKYLSATINQVQ